MSRSIFRHLLFGLNRKGRKPTRSPELNLEPLEKRRNPVSAIWIQDPSSTTGTLRIDGSGTSGLGENDRIRVRQAGGFVSVVDFRGGVQVLVPISNSPDGQFTVAAGHLSGINVNAGNGNDFVDLNSSAAGFEQLNTPATISGGFGSDSLAGGAGNDSISGGENADLIFGNEGNDSIDGGTGSDVLFGSDGDDTVLGGGGGFDQLF